MQFTALLLTRHLFAVVSGAGDYPFSLLTVSSHIFQYSFCVDNSSILKLFLSCFVFFYIIGTGILQVFIAKASGIVVPMYILIRILAALQTNIRHHYQVLLLFWIHISIFRPSIYCNKLTTLHCTSVSECGY